MPADATNERYRQTIRELSDRLVTAQKPIRILNAIKWDSSIQQKFFDSGFKEQPQVDAAYYQTQSLDFNPAEKRREFHELERDVQKRLGQFNPVGAILCRMCREYETVVRMLEARGTPDFSRLSQQLYGGANDVFHAGDPTLADLGADMSGALTNIDRSMLLQGEEKTITGEQAVEILQKRLNQAFPDPDNPVRVFVSDGIVADAAAGTDYLKIRKEAMFNERDIRLLEIHEGWVHVGTTLNGMKQEVCTFLSKGPPSATVTQEGLAILMEIVGYASHPARLRRLTNRIRAVGMAENGATFLDVFEFFRQQGFSDVESYTNASRVFRGSSPAMGPFTKDITYSKGFILVYNFIRLAVKKGLLDRIQLLFCGKTTLEDMKTLHYLMEEGLVTKPKYLPPHFADLNAIVAWMCYSIFLNKINMRQAEVDFSNIL